MPAFVKAMTQMQKFRKNGREYLRCPRYPNEVVMITIDLMVNSRMSARQVPRALTCTWQPWMKQKHIQQYMKGKKLQPPGRLACNKFRQMIPWLVRAQIGMQLTKSYWRCKNDKEVCLLFDCLYMYDVYQSLHPLSHVMTSLQGKLGVTLMGDGTELRRQHLESSVLELDDGTRVVLAPWPQGDKAGATTNKHVFKQTDMCQYAYGEMYKVCAEDRTGMPPPAPDGHLLTTVKKTTNGT